jgi:hypothetical protein
MKSNLLRHFKFLYRHTSIWNKQRHVPVCFILWKISKERDSNPHSFSFLPKNFHNKLDLSLKRSEQVGNEISKESQFFSQFFFFSHEIWKDSNDPIVDDVDTFHWPHKKIKQFFSLHHAINDVTKLFSHKKLK